MQNLIPSAFPNCSRYAEYTQAHPRLSRRECENPHSQNDKHPLAIAELPKLIYLFYLPGLLTAKYGGVVCRVMSYLSRYKPPIPHYQDIGRM